MDDQPESSYQNDLRDLIDGLLLQASMDCVAWMTDLERFSLALPEAAQVELTLPTAPTGQDPQTPEESPSPLRN